jgi:putative endonuclease
MTASKTRTLYAGVTSALLKRVWEHKTYAHEGFSKKYKCDRLVYVNLFDSAAEAIWFEKHLKGLSRAKKIALIEAENPDWGDLSEPWFRDDEVHEARIRNLRKERDDSKLRGRGV